LEPLGSFGQYPIIFADPPWRYDFNKDDADEIENHYPTMSLEEICALPVLESALNDCVLFLWATSPKLEEAFQVIRAWGFEYRTCAIWDKQWIGPGYYFRQRHELLLIATRGSVPVPPPSARPDSIFEEKRTQHSKKPVIAYQLIEAMYPELQKMEMFCRSPRPGWAVWGNQARKANL
jgi:N6-adenosine-specific RNA methylase IME4